jgi:hypothetical protein
MDHSVAADYYALGVITYELMLGRVHYNISKHIIEAIYGPITLGNKRADFGTAGVGEEGRSPTWLER